MLGIGPRTAARMVEDLDRRVLATQVKLGRLQVAREMAETALRAQTAAWAAMREARKAKAIAKEATRRARRKAQEARGARWGLLRIWR